jgi:hypothetical protein
LRGAGVATFLGAGFATATFFAVVFTGALVAASEAGANEKTEANASKLINSFFITLSSTPHLQNNFKC